MLGIHNVKTGLDFLTMSGTTEVLINKMINEQQPRVVYFASYRGKVHSLCTVHISLYMSLSQIRKYSYIAYDNLF